MISNNELLEIKGGAAKYFYGIGIGSVISFIVGLIDGYMRPLSCHK